MRTIRGILRRIGASDADMDKVSLILSSRSSLRLLTRMLCRVMAGLPPRGLQYLRQPAQHS